METKITYQLSCLANKKLLNVVEFKAECPINELMQLDVQVKLELFEDVFALMGEAIEFTINHYGRIQKLFGSIAEVSTLGSNGHYALAEVVIYPSFHVTKLRTNSRIFQQASVVDIVNTLLTEHNITHKEFWLNEQYPPREYCVQYQETDYDFIRRICAEDGLYFFFAHEKDDSIIFCDCKDIHSYTRDSLYNPFSGPTNQESYVKQFKQTQKQHEARVQYKDYNPYHPSDPLLIEQNHVGVEEHAFYQYPSGFKTDHNKQRAKLKSQWIAAQSHCISLSGNDPIFKVGYHTHIEQAASIFAYHIIHRGTQYQALEHHAGEGKTEYSCNVNAIPSELQWRPQSLPKPNILGSQLAIVSGPENEEIYCDAEGRIKVYFPWDRFNDNDDLSSCWVRVASQSAGGQYGFVAVPRIGSEVLVSFLHGDPDEPYVTGSLFNGLNPHPYELPQYKATTVLRSESYLGSGYNEISFDNVSGKERIFTRAQKDYEKWVGNNARQDIKGESHTTIEKHSFQHVKADKHDLVDGSSRIGVEQKFSISSQSLHVQQKADASYVSAGQTHIKGASVVVEAASKLCLKVGSSFVLIDGSGVNIVGAKIGLNSGGTPVQGRGWQGDIPILPNGIEQIPANPIEIDTLSFKKALDLKITPRNCNG
ncbi:TPA: type VI secretion system Vgr family protein [Photobacterium damselae]